MEGNNFYGFLKNYPVRKICLRFVWNFFCGFSIRILCAANRKQKNISPVSRRQRQEKHMCLYVRYGCYVLARARKGRRNVAERKCDKWKRVNRERKRGRPPGCHSRRLTISFIFKSENISITCLFPRSPLSSPPSHQGSASRLSKFFLNYFDR